MHCRLLPRLCSLPQMTGGSASALSLSRPAQASLTLRPAGSLSCPRQPLSRGSSPCGCPHEPLVSFRINRQLSGWNLPPLIIRAFGAQPTTDLRSCTREGPLAAARLSLLRFTIQLSLTGPDLVGVCRLIANHLHLAFFESTPEVRVLPSAGITQLQRSYDLVRLPPVPPPVATLRPLPSHRTDLSTGNPRLRGALPKAD